MCKPLVSGYAASGLGCARHVAVVRSQVVRRAPENLNDVVEVVGRTPFRRGGEALIRLDREDNRRHRRLSQGEEKNLLEHAPAHIRSMIITALDTGMRRGEMLALRFCDIDGVRQVLVLRGPTTKSKKTRLVPIGTARLKAVLEFQQLDGAGEQKADTAPVFSDAAGEPMLFPRKAWEKALADAGLKDLRWHDLRHEYASRLAERGVPLSPVRDLLGHASITTTERYDNQTLAALQGAARMLEDGKTFQNLSTSGSSMDESVEEPAQEVADNCLCGRVGGSWAPWGSNPGHRD
jgi:integrase